MGKITFRISRPYKIFETRAVDALVIPAMNGDLTVLPERAPTLALLTNGVVQILDENKKVVDRFFVKGGVADIARNRCAISSEKVVSFDSIDMEKALRKKEQAIHAEDKEFYQMVIDKLVLFKS